MLKWKIRTRFFDVLSHFSLECYYSGGSWLCCGCTLGTQGGGTCKEGEGMSAAIFQRKLVLVHILVAVLIESSDVRSLHIRDF